MAEESGGKIHPLQRLLTAVALLHISEENQHHSGWLNGPEGAGSGLMATSTLQEVQTLGIRPRGVRPNYGFTQRILQLRKRNL